MSATVPEDLIDEFELVLKEGTAEWRVRTLRQLSELLRSCVERLNPVQIDIFDDMLIRLLNSVGTAALAELSSTVADFASPPKQTIHQLARHQNPAVAGPLLSKSPVLIDADLIEIAKSRSQQHLVAVASRHNLSEELSDVIVKMAGRDASRALAKNPAARLSKAGLIVLLAKAKGDETIAESLALRPDLPATALRELLSRATVSVRAGLLKAAPAELKQKIQAELDSIGTQAKSGRQVPTMEPSDAHAAVAVLSRTGKLNDSTVNRFAIKQEHANVVAALVLLSGASVETIAPLMDETGGEGLIIACRASRLNWQTTSAVLNNRRVPPLSKQQLEDARQMFEMLLVSTAQYSIRFEPPRSSAATPHPNRGCGRCCRSERMKGENRRASRVRFDHKHPVNLMGVDGTWRRSCYLLDASASGAKLEIEGSAEVLQGREFFLSLSSTGLAFRRCEMVWVDGSQVGVRYIESDKSKKPRLAKSHD